MMSSNGLVHMDNPELTDPHIHADAGCCLEDLQRAMNNRDKWLKIQGTLYYACDLMRMMMMAQKNDSQVPPEDSLSAEFSTYFKRPQ